MASILGKHSKIRMAGRTPLAIALGANAPWTNSGDNQTYRITDKTKQYLELNLSIGSAISVEVDDGGGYDVIPSTDYVINPIGGRLTFNDPLAGAYPVRTQNGAYLPLITVGGGRGWSLDIQRNQLDATVFGDSTWAEFVNSIGGASGTIEGLWWDDDQMLDRLNETVPKTVVLSLQHTYSGAAPTVAQPRFEFFANLHGIGIDTKFDDLINQSVDFTADGQVYYFNDAPE
jgi:hypothetical protein